MFTIKSMLKHTVAYMKAHPEKYSKEEIAEREAEVAEGMEDVADEEETTEMPIAPLVDDFGRGDLNKMRDTINELIKRAER